jgi:hypothetical protein
MKESELGKNIQIILSAHGARMFRNNIGTLQDKNGKYVSYGLCRGSSDYIGFVTREVRQEDVGKRLAVFCAIEVKTPIGRATQEQIDFISAVKKAGGIAQIVHSIDEAIEAIK